MSELAKYTERAKSMTARELHYAISDVKETLDVWRGTDISHPYVSKLYAEFDAYTAERYKRINA